MSIKLGHCIEILYTKCCPNTSETHISQENYLCNIGPESADRFLQENNLCVLCWSAWANITQNSYLCNAETATRVVL